MMGRFFNWAMRAGPVILFWAAILTFCASMVGQFTVMSRSMQTMAQDHYSGTMPGMDVEQFIFAFGSALSSAAFLFFGALVINRMDRWILKREAAE